MIHVQELAVTFPGGVVALQPTNLSFEPGAFTVLLGPSGAGKSTLLRCLNHLQAPSAGHVEVEGLGRLSRPADVRRHRRRTAMIFQQHQLIQQATVLQNVLLGRLGYHGVWRSFWPFPRVDRELALQHLRRVGLFEKALDKVAHLSGGQQQRVGIARALTQEPVAVLADEPVASLDPGSSRRVLDLLRTVCKEQGLTAIVSLHQVEFTLDYADRVVGLNEGAVVFDGPPSALDDKQLTRIYGSGGAAETAEEEAGERVRAA